MTLHEAIEEVLKKERLPMKAKEIASSINMNGSYTRNDREPLQATQIYARVKNYPSLFQNINGNIVLVKDHTWKNIFTSYEYLTHSLKGIFNQEDIQFIIAVLFFYKRFVDINHRSGHSYPLAFDEKLRTSLDELLDGGRSLINGLKSLEDFHFAPEGVFDECARLLAKLDNYKIQEIWSVIKQIETVHLNDQKFGNLYEYFTTFISLDNNKAPHTPYSLRQLMAEILKPHNGASVYDPVAGIGGLLIETSLIAEGKINSYGSEINKRIAQLGNMNSLMYGIKDIEILAEDCFEQINLSKQYDYIIADLPANGITNSVEYFMLYNQYNLSAPKSGKSFGSMVLFILSKLNNDGKAVLTVSDGFLVKKGKEQSIREMLIAKDVIETIVSLPSGILRPYTEAKTSLLILNKNKSDYLTNRIQFITAKANDSTTKSVILNNDEIIKSYIDKESFNKDTQIIHIDDLKQDVNLLAESYGAEFQLANNMLKDNIAKFLGDLVYIKSGINPPRSSIQNTGNIPLVKVEKLSKDILDLNLNLHSIETISEESRYERNIILEECILVARVGDSLKATIFRPSEEFPRILPHNNIYVLIPSRSDLNIEYLYYQLHSTFIQEQIEKRKLGAVMPYISIAGLKDTVVPFMSIEAQHEFVQSQKANLIAEERKRVEERIKSLGYKEETKQAEADVIKILTHQLRPTFTGLNGITKRIDRVIKREYLGDLKEYDNVELNIDPEIEDQISLPDNYTLSQLIDKLSKETNHLSDILTNVDKVMNFTLLPEDLQEVDVLDFLKEYKEQKEVDQNDNYDIEIKGESANALLHKPSFKELLDQLLINAEKHAFIGDNKNKINKIQFTVRINKRREVVSIEYSNNGKPYELTQKDFITAFEKGNKSDGSGIGGNYINRIVTAQNGKLTVDENTKKGFFLTIELPTSNSKIYE
ncbi:N-6 DNA methylase [Flavobacterium sp. M31R6]|uniref:N-6 DNA methylase n=1 Tax=Flavobacterium sp. M31R6 TaxID=2739062 RepID=UPI001568C37B|nr:N-6 DNA methylase [Flavobacterium sp. M31R6]QKJ62842.1 N-6 DNA methylase [Flavobacterium sp. M31R6]